MNRIVAALAALAVWTAGAPARAQSSNLVRLGQGAFNSNGTVVADSLFVSTSVPTTRNGQTNALRDFVLLHAPGGLSAAQATNIANAVVASNNAFYVTLAAFDIALANSNNWNTAYAWGNHASAGYRTTDSNVVIEAGTGISLVIITNGTLFTYTITATGAAGTANLLSATDPIQIIYANNTVVRTNRLAALSVLASNDCTIYAVGPTILTETNAPVILNSLTNINVVGLGNPQWCVVLTNEQPVATSAGFNIRSSQNVVVERLEMRTVVTVDYGTNANGYGLSLVGSSNVTVRGSTVQLEALRLPNTNAAINDKSFVALGDAIWVQHCNIGMLTIVAGSETQNWNYALSAHDTSTNVLFDSCVFYGTRLVFPTVGNEAMLRDCRVLPYFVNGGNTPYYWTFSSQWPMKLHLIGSTLNNACELRGTTPHIEPFGARWDEAYDEFRYTTFSNFLYRAHGTVLDAGNHRLTNIVVQANQVQLRHNNSTDAMRLLGTAVNSTTEIQIEDYTGTDQLTFGYGNPSSSWFPNRTQIHSLQVPLNFWAKNVLAMTVNTNGDVSVYSNLTVSGTIKGTATNASAVGGVMLNGLVQTGTVVTTVLNGISNSVALVSGVTNIINLGTVAGGSGLTGLVQTNMQPSWVKLHPLAWLAFGSTSNATLVSDTSSAANWAVPNPAAQFDPVTPQSAVQIFPDTIGYTGGTWTVTLGMDEPVAGTATTVWEFAAGTITNTPLPTTVTPQLIVTQAVSTVANSTVQIVAQWNPALPVNSTTNWWLWVRRNATNTFDTATSTNNIRAGSIRFP